LQRCQATEIARQSYDTCRHVSSILASLGDPSVLFWYS
jgi:hypothetical protein